LRASARGSLPWAPDPGGRLLAARVYVFVVIDVLAFLELAFGVFVVLRIEHPFGARILVRPILELLAILGLFPPAVGA
jgi:hypothetical protein